MAQVRLVGKDHGHPLLSPPRRMIPRVLKRNAGFLFVLPAILLFLLLGLYPVAYSIALSFFSWNGFGGFSLLPPACEYPCRFVGLENFQDFLYLDPIASSFFWQAFKNNVIMAVGVTAGTVVIALPLAVALNQAQKMQAVYRTIIMLPMVTTGIAIFYVWSFIYNSDGLLNGFLGTIGLGFLQASSGWLGSPSTALGSLIAVMIWGSVPTSVLLYLAGLQAVSRDYLEAARIDGANALQILLRIIWPLLRPITVIIIILTMNGVMQGYEMVYLMTNGAPAGHTNVVGLQIFNYGFGDERNLGMASALAWILFVIVFVAALANLRNSSAKS